MDLAVLVAMLNLAAVHLAIADSVALLVETVNLVPPAIADSFALLATLPNLVVVHLAIVNLLVPAAMSG